MTSIVKILSVCVTVQWLEVNTNPIFQGLSFEKGFEINFKPWPIQPITIIKEICSPFGRYEKKIVIHKRSLDAMTRPAAPVFEDIEDEPIGTAPLGIKPIAPGYMKIPKVPLSLPKPMPIIINSYPPLSETSEPLPAGPPINSNMVIVKPSNGLYTDISKVEAIEKYIHGVEISQSEPPKPVVDQPTSLLPTPTLIDPTPLPPLSAIPPSPANLPPPVVSPTPLPPTPSEPLTDKPAEIPPNPVTPVINPIPPGPIIDNSETPIAPPPTLLVPQDPAPVDPVPSVVPENPVPIEEKQDEKPPPSLPVEPENNDPPKPENKLNNNVLVRGSKAALRFGSMFLKFMAQFFDKAHSTIGTGILFQ